MSKYSALTSSTRNIYSKKSRQIHSNKQNRPNSNDNIQKNKNGKNIYNNINNKKPKIMNLSKIKSKDFNNITFNNNNNYKKQNNYTNSVGLNNNKIEYVQINLFNNGHEDKNSKDKNYEKKKGNRNIKKSKKIEKEVKLFDSDINGSNDGLYMTKSFFSFNDKSKLTKDLCTPEESHFQAINYIQLILNNNKKFS